MIAEKVEYRLAILSKDEISSFLKLNDNDFFKKLSIRVDIDKYADKLSRNSKHFAAYAKDGTLVGLSCCYFNNIESKIAHISFTAILKGYRCRGIGSELIINTIDYGKRNQFKEIEVKVNCSNKVLMSFYKKNGFQIATQDESSDSCILKQQL